MKLSTRGLALIFSAFFFVGSAVAQNSSGDIDKAFDLVRKNVATLMLTDDDIANSYVSSTYITPEGLTMVYLQQAYKGIPVYNQLQVAAFKDEKIVSLAGDRISKLSLKVNEPNGVAAITPIQAVQKAALHLRLQPPSGLSQLPAANNYDNIFRFAPAGISAQNITVQALWTPVNESSIRLSWQVYVSPLHSADMWLVRVDALTGDVLQKTNLTVSCNWTKSASANAICEEQQAAQADTYEEDGTNAIGTVNYRVIPYPAESPIHPGGAHAIRITPWTAAPGNATTLNWQSNGTTEYTITRGNNVHAHLDLTDNDMNNGPADTSTAMLPDLQFIQAPNYTLAPTVRNNQRFATVNLFYWNNIMHDISYLYGFDEVAGNFQANNLSRGGLGNDYVQADAQDGGGTDNANFGTPVDGGAPRMQMYLFTYGTPGKDGDLDNGVIAHEYTHGISTRFTGGPANSSCLDNAEQMGEGWSDYFALMVTTNWGTATTSDGPTAHPIGNYVINQPVTGAGIRTYPYSTNMSINPWTYAMLPSTGGEEHNIGEIWCAILWDMTWNMIQMDGINTNLYNPTGTGGNSAALKLVTEGMRLQPCSPGFVDGRNAILKADTLFFGARYSCAIWAAFARRGLGLYASQGSSNNYTDGVANYISPLGIISYTFSADKTTAGGYEPVTYTSLLAAGNCGDANGYYITDTIPTNVTYLSGGTSYDAATRVVKINPVNIGSGRSQSYNIKVGVNANAYFPPTTYVNESVPTATIPATWTATSTVAAGWVTSTTNRSAPYSFFAVDPATVSDKMLATTNAYTLTGTTMLTFWHYYNLESTYDGGVVEISTNGGSTWTDLGAYMTTNGYNGTISTTNYGSPIQGRKAFTGNSGTFIQTAINLTSFAGQTVKFRFRMGSDNAVSATGWYIDDIIMKSEPLIINKNNVYNSSNVLQYSSTITMPVSPIILPVVWGNFSVQKQGSASLLVWSTLQETNTASFTIERSSDGTNFSPIATVAAAGNSNTQRNYTAKDALPLKGINYYRILQKDKDGKAVYTEIRSLTFDRLENVIAISPNPAKDKIAITIPGNTEKLSAQLVNTSGQAVHSFIISSQYSQQQLPAMAPGVYYLKMTSSTQTVVKKLVIE